MLRGCNLPFAERHVKLFEGIVTLTSGGRLPRCASCRVSRPGGDLGDQKFAIGDAAVETLATQHADLDLDHVEPAGVLGRVVELISRFS
jgi:hypothetical protein